MTTTATRVSLPVSPWLWLGFPTALALVLYAPLFPPLIREWVQFPALSHGFAIPIIAAYLVWARRDRLRAAAIEPSLWGLPIIAVGLLGLVLGVQAQESFAARASLPVTLLGLTIGLAGGRVAREAWIGIAYLGFMVPLPWATLKLITYRSRLFDANVSAYALGWLGVPVYQDGVVLQLPNITLEVADDCSSIPAIAALASLGVAYAALTWRPVGVRATLVLAAIPLAISANIVRITSTAAAAYYIGRWTLGTAYHHFNGTVNFLLTFMLLMLLDRGLAALTRWRAR